ncbi:putative sugar transport inner protein [Gloeomargarita lithophora Alchichica-D10]|uniref:Putative sugar transport inner protein n=1 Tax=Gloeomargarita lithophora Alchichica-D10 TaxID=1188229 RepID=A0A1J0A977_9CYAN|nr:carbohydrate ABC transporter permease [Gloeomargarita lithophora]APB32477.1 putative sugar transport inner protein [Gloeomargarita lithophora Alchichica-D10]
MSYRSLFLSLGLGIGAILLLFPGVIVVQTSLAPGWHWQNYRLAWQQAQLLPALLISLVVAGAVVLTQGLTAVLAGYALARGGFAGKKLILALIIASIVVPLPVLVIPVFLVLKTGHLLNTLGALILPSSASGFSIFLLRQYFLTIPIEIEAQAMLDGAKPWQILWEVILPLSRPALVTVGLLAFIGEWNDLFKPLVFTTRPELRTVQLALAGLQEQFTSDWGVLMAAIVLATLPVMGLFLWGQNALIQGIATSGLKR